MLWVPRLESWSLYSPSVICGGPFRGGSEPEPILTVPCCPWRSTAILVDDFGNLGDLHLNLSGGWGLIYILYNYLINASIHSLKKLLKFATDLQVSIYPWIPVVN